MIRKNLLPILLMSSSSLIYAQQLKFNEEGKFKIVQFTDVHFQVDNEKSDVAIDIIEEVLDKENPDVVVLTGDIVTCKAAQQGWQEVTLPMVERNIPFVVTFGNHDDEHGWSRDSISDLLQHIPGNLSADRSLYGNTDVALEVRGKNNRVEGVLYCFDSNSYSTLPHVKGYGWIKQDQVNWYRKKSMQYTRYNDEKPLPSLAFFHIPLPEYALAQSQKNTRSFGIRKEDECSPKINTGLFAAMQECGDVMGTFVGHDHVNDYVAIWQDIALAYGRFTGGKTTYGKLDNGARVIVMKEGERAFDTYVYTNKKGAHEHVHYPIVEKKKK